MEPDELNLNARWLLDEWSASLAAAAESMTGQRPQVEWKAERPAEAGGAASDTGWLWWEQQFETNPQLAMWVGVPAETWGEVGKRALQTAGIESSEPDDARKAYLEILSQSFGGLTQAIAARLGRDVASGPGREAPPATSVHGFSAALHYPGAELPLSAVLSAGLVEAVTPSETAAVEAAGGPDSDPAPAVEPSTAAETGLPSESAGASRNLDLLLDVELPVSVSFGRTELPIKEVLKLTTGSIVDLNRSLNEPVEVVVNNCVIARGEVVVIDGNYGVRLQQIVSRQDRLRSLK
jgi:flagellar motor switch protein FliN